MIIKRHNVKKILCISCSKPVKTKEITIFFRLLLNGAKLIAIHEAKYYKRSDGLALGPGCFTRGLEYSAQCRAKVVGKPNPNFFLSAIEDVKPNEAVMIGDVSNTF